MKIHWLFFIFFLISSCDDGDLVEQKFNFANSNIQKCTTNNTLYKINDQEALIFTSEEKNFPQKDTIQNIQINTLNRVDYKKFSSITNSNNICEIPTLPIIEEWNVTGGTIQIKTSKIPDNVDLSKVIAYNHLITFKNITFNTPKGQIVYDNYEFGNYRTNVVDLKFNYDNAVLQNCNSNNLLFKYDGSNALLLDIDPNLYNHKIIGTKTALINSTNKVVYRIYDGSLNSNFFCQSIPSISPSLKEEWKADEGITNKSGIIIIETTQQTPTTYKHIIKIRNVIFRKGVATYSPAPNGDYIFAQIIN